MAVRRRRDIWDVVIVGGGMAGLSAAWQSSRRGLSVALFEPAPAYGGQVATVNTLDDWPGTGSTSGVELAAAMAERLRAEGVELINEAVSSIVPGEKITVVKGGGLDSGLRARRVIVAAGARLRPLGVPGEEELRGRGVSQCAHCDGGFFKGQDVVVVGGGDAALQEAIVLAETCATVHIVVRSGLRARRAFAERADSKINVKFIWDSVVEAVQASKDGGAVAGVRLLNLKTGAKSELSCSGVFPFVGVEPNTGFLSPSVQRNAAGLVTTDEHCRSSEPSIYAIGALRAGYGGDLVNAAGEAVLAAAALAGELRL